MVEALEEAKKDMLNEGFTKASKREFLLVTKFALRKKNQVLYLELLLSK